jgi:gliding motility-associated-like protein
MPIFYQTKVGILLVLVLVFIFFVPLDLKSQNYNMDAVNNTTIRSCSGNFFDSGGPNGNYANRENFTVTFCSATNQPGKSARLTFRELDLRELDILTFYDGPTTAAPLLQTVDRRSNNDIPFAVSATRTNQTGCLTVTFVSRRVLVIPSEGRGWRAEIGCIDRCQIIQSELVSSSPAIMPTDTGWIDVCIGQEIRLQGRGIFPQEGLYYSHSNSSEYFWDLGDGTRKSGTAVTHTYQKAGGYLIQFNIIDQVGCVSSNSLDQRARVAPKPTFTIQEMPQFCIGDTINLTGTIDSINTNAIISARAVEATFEPRYERSDSLFLPDGKGVAYETSVNITQFSPGQQLENIDDLLGICVNIEHSYMRDLQVSIKCPSGVEAMLQKFEDKGRREVYLGVPIDIESDLSPGLGYDYCWTPNATTGTWTEYAQNTLQGRTLPAGDYNSLTPLDTLLGCPLNGEWTIIIEDFLLQDNGYIFEWSISFNPDLYPALEKFKPQLTHFQWIDQSANLFGENQNISPILNTAGNNIYQFIAYNEFGCAYDTTVAVQSLPLSHPDCYQCVPILNGLQDVTYCNEDIPNISANTQDLTQNIQFDAFPNFNNLSATNHPVGAPFSSSIMVNSITPDVIDNLSNIVSVCIDVESSANNPLSDIAIQLEAPNGRRMDLVNNTGTLGGQFRQTCFTPTATNNIRNSTSPYSGEFQAMGNWNNLLDSDINGEWRLLVTDRNGAELSSVLHWSISFRSQNEITYSWTPSNQLSCVDCPEPTIISNNQVNSIFSLQVNDQYGCSDSDTMTVTNISNVDAPSIRCSITNNKELAIEWNDTFFDTHEISINGRDWFQPNEAQSYLLSGLDKSEEVSIAVRPIIEGLPLICSLPTNDTVCIYIGCELELAIASANLTLKCADDNTGSAIINWIDGDAPFNFIFQQNAPTSINQTNYLVENLGIGRYQFIIYDAESCSDTLHFEVSSPPALNLAVNVENPRCANDQNGVILLTANGGVPQYQYSMDGVVFRRTPSFTQLSAGSYTVVVKDQNDCEFQEQVNLISPNALEVFISQKDDFLELEYGETEQLFTTLINNQGEVNYQWKTITKDSTLSCLDCPNPFIAPKSSTYYEVEVVDEKGCKSRDKIQVRVNRTFKFYIPNAFSPNNDGQNERLTVYSEAGTKVKSFKIFDRWGGLIFANEDFPVNEELQGWDGLFKGKDAPMGTYVWFADVEYTDGVRQLFTGSTELMR